MATKGEDQELEFLQSIYTLLEEECVIKKTKENRVINYVDPEELKNQLDFDLSKTISSNEELLALCRQVIRYSVKTRHPHFRNQLYGGVDLYGLGGTWLTEALNTNQHTFEVAPAFTLCEAHVLEHVRQKFGYATGDGIFTPGGSMSNMYGMVLARYWKFPEVKSKGLCGLPEMVGFTSDQAHYSIQKGMHWLGFGIDNLIKVKSDEKGRMLAEEFEKAIQKSLRRGLVPLFVCATVGTTVLGAIDPLRDIAAICRKYEVWMHVDACFGGSLILSDTHQRQLDGIGLSDSIAWNPHKMLGAPLQCSVFITQHKDLMLKCNSASASYLFQQDKHYDVRYDTGDKSVQCGRKVDAFKLWVMWKARGDQGFSNLVDNVIKSAQYFCDKIQSTPGFRMVLPEVQTACICFWYIPTKLRDQEENEDWWTQLYLVAPKIKERMVREGTLMIGYQPVKNYGNFFRFVISCHPQTSSEDMEYVIDKIVEYGEMV